MRLTDPIAFYAVSSLALCSLRDPIQTVKTGHVYLFFFFFFFRRVPSWLLCHFLPWETYLGSGAAVEGDYRPLSSKPWEETCCTTGYRKTANRRPVIKIHTVSWCAASGGKTSETSGKNTTKLTYWNRTEWVLEKKKKSKKFWVKVWSISWLEFRFQQLLNET